MPLSPPVCTGYVTLRVRYVPMRARVRLYVRNVCCRRHQDWSRYQASVESLRQKQEKKSSEASTAGEVPGSHDEQPKKGALLCYCYVLSSFFLFCFLFVFLSFFICFSFFLFFYRFLQLCFCVTALCALKRTSIEGRYRVQWRKLREEVKAALQAHLSWSKDAHSRR